MEEDASRFAALKLAEIRCLLDAQLRAAAGLGADGASPPVARASELAVTDVPACWLQSRLSLTDDEERVLWLVLGFEASIEIRDSVRTLTRDSEELTVDAIERIIYGEASYAGWKELAPNAPLRRMRLLRVESPHSMRHRQTVSLIPRVRGLMLGDRSLTAELDGIASLRRRGDLSGLVVTPGVRERVEDLLQQCEPYIVATGMDGSGRASVLLAAAHARGYDVIDIECGKLREGEELQNTLAVIAREARVLNSAILLRDVNRVAEDDLRSVEQLLHGARLPILATAGKRPTTARGLRDLVEVRLLPLEAGPCAELWQRAVPMASNEDVAHLVATYPLAPAVIHSVGRRIAAAASETVTGGFVKDAIAHAVDDRLFGLARRVNVTQAWEDLVLPEDQRAMVSELLARIRRRRTVYERWGFQTKLSRGLGVTALFSGPPGTGKTMAAGLIANELGLQLYQVDLAQMVSKWIGETEKNLSSVFDAAESSQAILLFDEADSLFGKRTEVKSSNDRYANLETNFLLQRLETFTGICLLTTNHETAIDDAFRRRIAFHLRLSMPEEEERAALWRALIPSTAPIADDVDFEELGRRIELSGGYIRNAVLRAAFMAADVDSPIMMNHLRRAAQLECEAAGKLSGAGLARGLS